MRVHESEAALASWCAIEMPKKSTLQIASSADKATDLIRFTDWSKSC